MEKSSSNEIREKYHYPLNEFRRLIERGYTKERNYSTFFNVLNKSRLYYSFIDLDKIYEVAMTNKMWEYFKND